tara:strand:+ start:9181 stop:9804 length:624 start_codon:yes stop_codon:yes gene_type:complete
MNTRLLLLATTLGFAPAALAQAPASPLSDLFACEAVSDDAARLVCLDSAVAALHSSTESGDVIAIERVEVEAAEEATFGLDIPGFHLPSLPRFALPGSSGEARDLAAADAASAAQSGASNRVVTRDDDGQIARIENLAVASVRFSRSRKVIVTLENGQVWQQLDSDSTHIPRSETGAGGATIRAAALGSYMMRLGEDGRWFRTTRSQ